MNPELERLLAALAIRDNVSPARFAEAEHVSAEEELAVAGDLHLLDHVRSDDPVDRIVRVTVFEGGLKCPF